MVKCFPCSFYSKELADYAKPFLVSLIYGYDIFARMNEATAMDFKWRLIHALSVCDVPKYRILTHGLRSLLRKKCLGCCCCASSITATVGSDTRLFSDEVQRELVYPRPVAANGGCPADDSSPASSTSSHEDSQITTSEAGELIRARRRTQPDVEGSGPSRCVCVCIYVGEGRNSCI